MSDKKCIIILSEKSSGSSACQNLLLKLADVQCISKTRHFQSETLYWTKAASVLDRPQLDMVDSEVPIEREKAKTDLITLLSENLDEYAPPDTDEELIMEGWRRLCDRFAPIFLEKSPHHLCQWSAIELIVECIRRASDVDFLVMGLIRNPMDTIYSQYMRWKSSPEDVQKQWIVAYRNLLRLRDILGNRVVIVRYEDMVSQLGCLKTVFDFCGVRIDAADENYLHQKSLQKWKKDRRYDFALSDEAIELAETYGYGRDELVRRPHFLLSALARLSRVLRK